MAQKRKKIKEEDKATLKDRFRYLPASISVAECHRRLVGATGIDVAKRTFENWVRTEKWKRDLSDEVKRETAQRLMEAKIREGATQTNLSEEELDGDIKLQIQAAAAANVSVLLAHQNDIGAMRRIYATLVKDLADQVENHRVAVKDQDGQYVQIAPSINYGITQSHNLTKMLKDLIGLERQAYGADEEKESREADDILRELAEEAESSQSED